MIYNLIHGISYYTSYPVIKLCKCIALAHREKVNRPPDPDNRVVSRYGVTTAWDDEEAIESFAKTLPAPKAKIADIRQQNLVVNAETGAAVGDFFTIPGVNSLGIFKEDTGHLKRFRILKIDGDNWTITPAIIPLNVSDDGLKAYSNVTSLPSNQAAPNLIKNCPDDNVRQREAIMGSRELQEKNLLGYQQNAMAFSGQNAMAFSGIAVNQLGGIRCQKS